MSIVVNNEIEKTYDLVTKRYEDIGINTDEAIDKLIKIPISIQAWQGDDVGGFERPNAELAGGGIITTGNYPGKARNIQELKADLDFALSLIPGKHRINLHSFHGDFGGEFIERNKYTPEQFQTWIDWAKEKEVKLDLNCTLFSHPKADNGFTLSSKSNEIRQFWVEHCIACRKIGNWFGHEVIRSIDEHKKKGIVPNLVSYHLLSILVSYIKKTMVENKANTLGIEKNLL